MDAKYFCTTMQSELVGLKSRVYDIISTIETMPAEKRGGLQEKLPEFHSLIGEIAHMVDELKMACPAEFSSEKKAIEAKKEELMEKMNVWDAEHIAGGYVGG
jgi:hypothetical protein